MENIKFSVFEESVYVLFIYLQAQEITGIPVPKYYNPAAVNPLKYAEQVQKRKLLWSKAKDHKEVGDLQTLQSNLSI